MVDDLREKKLKQEQAAREARIKARNAEKLRLKKLREQFRADGVIRAADARIAADEIKKRKLLEVKREASERTQMCLAEADQKVVDILGLHLHKERSGASPRWLYLSAPAGHDERGYAEDGASSPSSTRKGSPSAAPVDPFEEGGRRSTISLFPICHHLRGAEAEAS